MDDLGNNVADYYVSFLSMTALDGSQPSPFRVAGCFSFTPQ